MNKSIYLMMVVCVLGYISNAQNADLLKKTVKFYGAQRCGNNHNWILVNNASGTSCHHLDGEDFAPGTDLTEGWHDAGDFIKFSLTNAAASYALLKGYESFQVAFTDDDDQAYSGAPNGIPDILDEVKVATDYLIKANIDANTMIARVGGDQDHDYWVTSPYQTGMSVAQGGGARPVISNAKADICGSASAALALMSIVYEPFDATYALLCKQKAETIFQIGLNNQATTADSYYPDGNWKDNMMCGAIELYKATQNNTYYTYATNWEGELGRHYWVLDWANQSDLGRHSLYQSGYGVSSNWQNDVNSYLTKVTTNTYVNGLAYFGDWGSLRYAANSALSAALLFTATNQEQYKTFSLSQLDYIKGNNEYNRSFIVGNGNNPPTKPHHKNSYGRDALDWNLTQNHLFPLVGAMVAGPTKNQADVSAPGYVDDIQDYVGNEVSIDYNSGIVGVIAFAESLTVNIQKLDREIGNVIIKIGMMHYSIPYYSNNFEVQVYDIFGREILSTKDKNINLDNYLLTKGYYIVRVKDSNGKSTSASVVAM